MENAGPNVPVPNPVCDQQDLASIEYRLENPTNMTMKDYRIKRNEEKKERLHRIRHACRLGGKSFQIMDMMVYPSSVDMATMNGTEKEKSQAVEEWYHNGGLVLNPTMTYPADMIDRFGKNFAQNAQGIYYHHWYNPKFVTCDRKVWIPSLDDVDCDEPYEADRRRRARIFSEHAKNNEDWSKSEFAWEADAWSDVFGQMRDDPYLTVDKHEYNTKYQNTREVFCTLTGDSTFVKRIPDATFGLATFSDYSSPVQSDQLDRDSLEKLLLHPKCGLISDPAWGSTNLAFPFAVYEAKGWSGDCREARRQACSAAAVYLDLLDNLARKPGPVDCVKTYQTPTSHRYQVFALTSFGAHWHLLVGYRRPRVDNSASCGDSRWEEPPHFAGTKGMSDTVYIFQRLWSGRVTDEMMAWELLSLLDQIHNWAKTDHRAFVLEHLKPWHEFCSGNYLLDWDSKYNIGQKRKRIWDNDNDLPLPNWTIHLSDQKRERLRNRAKESLVQAQSEDGQRKGKGRAGTPILAKGGQWHCGVDECGPAYSNINGTNMGSLEKVLDHLQIDHGFSGKDLAEMRDSTNYVPVKPNSTQTRSDQTAVGSCMSGIGRAINQFRPKNGVAEEPDHDRRETSDGDVHQKKAVNVPQDRAGPSKKRKVGRAFDAGE